MKYFALVIVIFISFFSITACKNPIDDSGGAGADFDSSQYYSKEEMLDLLDSYYTKSEIDSVHYVKTEVDSLIAGSGTFNASLYYTKSDIDSDFYTKTSVNDLLLPVGSIVGWPKSLSGTPQTLPGSWIECDGSTISDAESPFNGFAVPALNSGRFLRGASTSGSVGGSTSSTHTHSLKTDGGNWLALAGSNTAGMGNMNKTTDSGVKSQELNSASISTLPPYYEVVWIIRIK